MENLTIENLKLSLVDILGTSYLKAVCSARSFLNGLSESDCWKIAAKKVNLFPQEMVNQQDSLLDQVGKHVCPPFNDTHRGAATSSFVKASHTNLSPLSGYGFLRIGEDGRLYLISKSEHYHASVGHSFPGYQLIDHAKVLGIPNPTHNNTRGYITRLLEEELVRIANGISPDDQQGLAQIIQSKEPHVLNRVINLETGSLAVEAAFKMMLARFYRLEDNFESPKYQGRIPVFLVIADQKGGKKANYHGTTIFTQFLRGMWPDLSEALSQSQIMLIQPVMINDIAHFRSLVEQYDQSPYKIAGFFHEIILMNYGGIRLDQGFLQQAYTVCHQRDIPVMVDEIQSCIWSPDYFLFREYGLQPDFVSIGKGFPGGEYPASRILTTTEMDNLNQFGALVTNGQEELASLSYLITMAFVNANREYIHQLGEYYHSSLCEQSPFGFARVATDLLRYLRFLNTKTALSESASSRVEYFHALVWLSLPVLSLRLCEPSRD